MPLSAERTDGELLSAVVAGDGAAFATFYRRHLPAVVAFLVRETGDREATADLTAEVFAAVFLVAGVFARGAPARLGRGCSASPATNCSRAAAAAASIARKLGCSELVARQRVSRGLARLRDQLTEREQ